MLHVENKAHYEAVLAFADKVELRGELDEQLRFLDVYAEHGNRGVTRCRLGKDFGAHSFSFVMERRGADGEYHQWFLGALIFHGPHDNGGDGSYPTLAVCIEPTVGWSIHT